MNTYSHVTLTAAAARRLYPARRGLAWSAAAGALLPDLPYLARGARLVARRGRRLTVRELMAQLDYFGETSWPPDLLLHSLLTPAAAAAAAGALRLPAARTGLAAFAAGWAAHNLVDLLMHHDDARPPFWPLSRRRWPSPLSGSEPGAHAAPVLAAEHLLVAAVIAQAVATRTRRHHGARPQHAAAALGDARRLVAAFATHPRQVGAILPTSRRTAQAMLGMTTWGSHTAVIAELGAGTGAFTGEILRLAPPEARILAVELDPHLAGRLTARFRDDRLEVICGRAEDLPAHLGGTRADLIVSALPLTSLPAPAREHVLATAAQALSPGGSFLQIQYSRARELDLFRHFGGVWSKLSLANVPPAVLYCCRTVQLPADSE